MELAEVQTCVAIPKQHIGMGPVPPKAQSRSLVRGGTRQESEANLIRDLKSAI